VGARVVSRAGVGEVDGFLAEAQALKTSAQTAINV
jgi:hypothetical protein